MAALPHQLLELGRDHAAAARRKRHELTAPEGRGHCWVSGTSSAVRDLPSAGVGQAALARAVL